MEVLLEELFNGDHILEDLENLASMPFEEIELNPQDSTSMTPPYSPSTFMGSELSLDELFVNVGSIPSERFDSMVREEIPLPEIPPPPPPPIYLSRGPVLPDPNVLASSVGPAAVEIDESMQTLNSANETFSECIETCLGSNPFEYEDLPSLGDSFPSDFFSYSCSTFSDNLLDTILPDNIMSPLPPPPPPVETESKAREMQNIDSMKKNIANDHSYYYIPTTPPASDDEEFGQDRKPDFKNYMDSDSDSDVDVVNDYNFKLPLPLQSDSNRWKAYGGGNLVMNKPDEPPPAGPKKRGRKPGQKATKRPVGRPPKNANKEDTSKRGPGRYSPYTRPQNTMTPAKRENHNEMERIRRVELRNNFDLLRKAVPVVREKTRSPKVEILKTSNAFVHTLEQESSQLENLKSRLSTHNQSLLLQLETLQGKFDDRTRIGVC